MNYEAQLKQWIGEDAGRMTALSMAAEMQLPDWCLAAGFVRNLAWDRVHSYTSMTALNDIDLIYFDRSDITEEKDRCIEERLRNLCRLPWSVKNQARMHGRNKDDPYSSTADAMSYWVEVETAVGATLNQQGELHIVAPFGVESLFNCTVTLNPKRPKLHIFENRIAEKRWLEIWPRLAVIQPG